MLIPERGVSLVVQLKKGRKAGFSEPANKRGRRTNVILKNVLKESRVLCVNVECRGDFFNAARKFFQRKACCEKFIEILTDVLFSHINHARIQTIFQISSKYLLHNILCHQFQSDYLMARPKRFSVGVFCCCCTKPEEGALSNDVAQQFATEAGKVSFQMTPCITLMEKQEYVDRLHSRGNVK